MITMMVMVTIRSLIMLIGTIKHNYTHTHAHTHTHITTMPARGPAGQAARCIRGMNIIIIIIIKLII